MPRLYLGVDIGGTKLAAALVEPGGRIHSRGKLPTPRGAGAKALLRAVRELAGGLLRERGLRPRDLRGAGVGVPGIVGRDGRILAAPNVPLGGVRPARELAGALGPKVAVGNDVNLGVLGEQWLGAARGCENVVGLFPGTGVGGGVIVAGKLLLGEHGAAAELGHIVVEPGGPKCGCGTRGCLEALASRTAIEREIREAVHDGKKSIVTKLAKPGLKVIKSKVLAKALKKGDEVATKAVRGAAEALGLACVSLRRTLDPERFVLGGGVIEACGAFILPIVQKAIDGDRFFRRVSRCRAVAAELEDDSVILGAVALARRTF